MLKTELLNNAVQVKRFAVLFCITLLLSGTLPSVAATEHREAGRADEIWGAFHPQQPTILIHDAHQMGLYTPDFRLIQQVTFLSDDVKPSLYPVNWSSTGQFITVQAGETLQIWDTTSFKKLYEVYGISPLVQIAWKPDDSQFAAVALVGENTGKIHIFSSLDGSLLRDIDAFPSELAWSPDNNQLVFDNQITGELQVFDAETSRPIRTLPTQAMPVSSLEFSLKQNWIAFINSEDDHVIEIWNTDTAQRIRTLEWTNRIVAPFNWTKGGLVSHDFEGSIQVWDVEKGTVIKTFQTTRYADGELDSMGTYLLVNDRNSGPSVLDAASGEILSTFSNLQTATPDS
jgi:WD40 repeat protein